MIRRRRILYISCITSTDNTHEERAINGETLKRRTHVTTSLSSALKLLAGNIEKVGLFI